MDRFKILERCRENAEKWEGRRKSYKGEPSAEGEIFHQAEVDWRTLEAEIEASIKEETDGLLRQEKGNAPPPSSAE